MKKELTLNIGALPEGVFYNSAILTESAQRKFGIELFIGVVKQNQVKRLYQASVDTFAAAKFHELCDGKGPTLTLIKTTANHIFGGYTT